MGGKAYKLRIAFAPQRIMTLFEPKCYARFSIIPVSILRPFAVCVCVCVCWCVCVCLSLAFFPALSALLLGLSLFLSLSLYIYIYMSVLVSSSRDDFRMQCYPATKTDNWHTVKLRSYIMMFRPWLSINSLYMMYVHIEISYVSIYDSRILAYGSCIISRSPCAYNLSKYGHLCM